MLRKAYGDQVLSRTTVYEWFKGFKEGREWMDDDERSGRPASIRTDESVEKIWELIRKDCCMSSRLIEDVTAIRKSQINRILNEDLKLRKVFAQFIPHTLSDDQKHARLLHAQDIILTPDKDENFLKQSWLMMKHGVINTKHLQSDIVHLEKLYSILKGWFIRSLFSKAPRSIGNII